MPRRLRVAGNPVELGTNVVKIQGVASPGKQSPATGISFRALERRRKLNRRDMDRVESVTPLDPPRAPVPALAWKFRAMHRLLTVILLAAVTTGSALALDPVARVLAAQTPPPGVVFEVVSGDEGALRQALPAIRKHARRLRERFPRLPLAVLAHGKEQFSLLTSKAAQYGPLHDLVTAFTREDGIPVQVCGNHASFRGNGARDFPDHVDVVPSAPGKLHDYREAGYVIILM